MLRSAFAAAAALAVGQVAAGTCVAPGHVKAVVVPAVVQPIIHTVPVPTYSFQFLPAVATYTTPVVPPLAAIVGQVGAQPGVVGAPVAGTHPAAPQPPAPPAAPEVDDGPPEAVGVSTAGQAYPSARVAIAPTHAPQNYQPGGAAQPAAGRPEPDLTGYGVQILQARCARCHTGAAGKGDVSFFNDAGAWVPGSNPWAAVWESVRAGRMPPQARAEASQAITPQEKDVLRRLAGKP